MSPDDTKFKENKFFEGDAQPFIESKRGKTEVDEELITGVKKESFKEIQESLSKAEERLEKNLVELEKTKSLVHYVLLFLLFMFFGLVIQFFTYKESIKPQFMYNINMTLDETNQDAFLNLLNKPVPLNPQQHTADTNPPRPSPIPPTPLITIPLSLPTY